MDNYENCPVGIRNAAEIERLKDRFTLMLENVENKIDDIKGDVNNLSKRMDKRFEEVDKRFEEVDKRFDQVDEKLENFDKSLPEKIDTRITQSHWKMSNKAIMWIFGLGGAAVSAIVIAVLKNILGL